MSARRLLGDTLAEITTGTLGVLANAPGLRMRRIALTLPIEVELRRSSDRIEILGDLPRSVTRTAFDIKPDRLVVVWQEDAS